MSGVFGFAGQLALSADDSTYHQIDFDSESLALDEQIIDTNGLRGTRARSTERLRAGNQRVGGQLKLQPTELELSYLLAWILGGTPTGTAPTTYPLADGLTGRYVHVNRVSSDFKYSGVFVDRAVFHGSQGGPLQITLDVVGQTETSGSSFPGSLTLDTSTLPFIFTDLTLTVNGTAYLARDFELSIANDIDRERFFNSQTLATVQPRDRHVALRTNLPYGDANALYNAGAIESGGLAATAVFNNGSNTLTFTIASLVFPRQSPVIRGREEIMIPIEGRCMKSGSTLELVTTM